MASSAEGPYRPPWYPNRDPLHNPWAVANAMSGNNVTYYEVWTKSLPPGELRRLINEHLRSLERSQ